MASLYSMSTLAASRLLPVETDYVVLWEDPDQLDAPAKVTYPAPMLMAMLMAGKYMPPVEEFAKASNDSNYEYEPQGSLTEEQAIEYIIKATLPERVWDGSSNRTLFRICKKEQLPTDRAFRQTWRVAA